MSGNTKNLVKFDSGVEVDVTDLFELASDWFWVMDQDLRYVYFSPRVEEVTGDPPEWHIGRTREELGVTIYSGSDRLRNRQNFQGQLVSRKGSDGRVIWIRASGKAIFADDGSFSGYIGTGTDVTSEIEAQWEAEERHVLFTNAMSNMTDGFALFDASDRLAFWNERFTDINPELVPVMSVGISFEDLVRDNLAKGRILDAVGREEEFLTEWMAQHRNPSGEAQLSVRQDGRILSVREIRMGDGSSFLINIDMTETKRYEAELREARDDANAASQAKSEFPSSMSHELRTPLNAILGFGQLLETDPNAPLPEHQLKAVRQILKDGDHLLSLIDEVLDLARIESGQASIDRGMEAGFHTYLAKPIRLGEILALLEGLRPAPAAISV